jgi:hypothetical protein
MHSEIISGTSGNVLDKKARAVQQKANCSTVASRRHVTEGEPSQATLKGKKDTKHETIT